MVKNTLIKIKNKIKLSKKIQTINQGLLEGCSSLTEIEIPEGVESIGYAAFKSCDKLTTITLPASLTSLSGAAIARLNRLTEIIVLNLKMECYYQKMERKCIWHY